MRIEECDNPLNWNMFLIPISMNEGESELEYLTKIRDCINDFFLEYTLLPDNHHSRGRRFTQDDPEGLPNEHNFSSMCLHRYMAIDVKYRALVPSKGWNMQGIRIYSHSDMRDYYEPMLDFLKEKWKEFDYQA